MTWRDLDVPNLPFKKPEELEKIERLEKNQRESMVPYEREHFIQEAANSIANSYQKQHEEDSDGCKLLIENALREMGAFLGGDFGTHMVGISSEAAEKATKQAYEIFDFD